MLSLHCEHTKSGFDSTYSLVLYVTKTNRHKRLCLFVVISYCDDCVGVNFSVKNGLICYART
jgi:hypothetical protein